HRTVHLKCYTFVFVGYEKNHAHICGHLACVCLPGCGDFPNACVPPWVCAKLCVCVCLCLCQIGTDGRLVGARDQWQRGLQAAPELTHTKKHTHTDTHTHT